MFCLIKGYAFIKFHTKESAANAICTIHNTEISGQSVKCSWGKESGDLTGGQPASSLNAQYAAYNPAYWQQYAYNPYAFTQAINQQFVQNPNTASMQAAAYGYNGYSAYAANPYWMQNLAAAANVNPATANQTSQTGLQPQHIPPTSTSNYAMPTYQAQ